MSHTGMLLILVGLAIALIGLLWMVVPSIPWLGRLPGDIRVEGENGSFYFPLATCLLLSAILSACVWIVRWWRS